MAARTATRASVRRGRRRTWVGRVKRGLVLFLTILGAGFIAIAIPMGVEIGRAKDKLANLPALRDSLRRPPSTIYASDGSKLFEISTEYRQWVNYEDIPKHVIDAVVAAEDKRFFEHSGVDLEAIMRVLFEAAKDRRFTQGGSTITMQLAKRLYSQGEQTLHRKMQDIAVALAIEQELSKEEVLEFYLNQVFFGSGAYGIQAAANVYFNKPLKTLTVGEAAMLARTVRRPTEQNPFKDYEKALQNRNIVLNIMRTEGMINTETFNKAREERPKLNPNPPATSARIHLAPYFVQHVESILREEFPGLDLSEGGYKVFTTLDKNLQRIAEKEVRRVVEENKGMKVTTGAFVVLDHRGRILAEVGGVDFKRNQYNVITQGRRQPGSAFKPFVYSAAFAQGVLGPDDYISNAPFIYRDPWTGQVWKPVNSNGKYGGPVSVKTAFAFSYNIPAIRTIEKVGPTTVVDYARNTFGFRSPLTPYMSLALGVGEVSPLEMAQAFTVFMTGGDRVQPMAITRVIGPDGQVMSNYEPVLIQNVLDPRVAREMDELMRAVVTSGTGTRAAVVPNARGKTGTTQENKDAWFCGYTDGLVGIGWVANERRINGRPVYEPMHRRAFGGTITVQMWAGIMKEAHKRYARKMPEKNLDVIAADAHFGAQSDETRDSEQARSQEDTTQPDPGMETPVGTPSPNPTSEPRDQPPGEAPPPDMEPADRVDEPVRDIEDRPVPPPRPRPEPPPVQYTDIEVCADSRMVAGMYCPETVVRTYRKGQEPKKRCTQHGPR